VRNQQAWKSKVPKAAERVGGLPAAHFRRFGEASKKEAPGMIRGASSSRPTRRWAQIPNGRLCFLSKLKREAIVPTIAAPIFRLLLRRLLRRLTAAGLSRLAGLLLDEALLAAFQKLLLGDLPSLLASTIWKFTMKGAALSLERVSP
jgi:hypothetical protein